MTSNRRAAPLAVLMALFVAVFSSLVAIAPAQAYPEDTCSVGVSSQTVGSGDRFTVQGEASQPRSWRIAWNSDVRTVNGATFKVTLQAPEVATTKVLKLRVRSSEAPGAAAQAACSRSFEITVAAAIAPPAAADADDPDDSGLLPNTGGVRLLLLLAALALLAAGTAAVLRGRRRQEGVTSANDS